MHNEKNWAPAEEDAGRKASFSEEQWTIRAVTKDFFAADAVQ